MRIGIDIMGGDYAPKAPLEGVLAAIGNLSPQSKIVLIGNESVINNFLDERNADRSALEIVHAPEVIEMGESPTKAFSQKRESSIAIGFSLLQKNEIDVFLSAGNTGSMMVGSLYTVKAVEGILRPAITSLLPRPDSGNGIILDVGVNADCKPEALVQFAILGTMYSKHVFKIDKPRVGLLNIGSEPEKGNLVTQATYPLLEANKKINFIGNIEGYDIFRDSCDVIVCDGFTGNVVLKEAESFYDLLKQRNIKDSYFDRFDYQNYGGTPILGVNKPVIIGHGVSSPTAFQNMINLASEVVESKLIEKIKTTFEE